MDKLGVSVSLTSGYHPQANGQVGRANKKKKWFSAHLNALYMHFAFRFTLVCDCKHDFQKFFEFD